MLICPQCQFENPNTNNFCQKCGTSLTHKTCEECSTQVPIQEEICHNCGAFTGTVWWAIISQEPDAVFLSTNAVDIAEETSLQPVELGVDTESSQPETLPTTPSVSNTSSDSSSLESDNLDTAQSPTSIEPSSDQVQVQTTEVSKIGNQPEQEEEQNLTSSTIDSSLSLAATYLDPQQRYRLLEPLSQKKPAMGQESNYGTSVRVLDCQPFQKSLLQALMEQQTGDSQPQSSNILGIPGSAQPYIALKEYLTLKESYHAIIPDVHDAWQQDGESVLLLEDRSGWPLLSDLWGNEEIPTLQILSWLGEMAQLWEALEPWHCRQSLLEVTNLRVDKYGVLCLERLYPDPEDQPLTLEDLGQMWRRLFSQSQRTQLTSLGDVFRQLCTGEITTLEELRFHLEAIAQTEQFTNDQEDVPVAAESSPPIAEASAVRQSPTNEVHPTPTEGGELPPTVILPMQLLSLDDAGATDIGYQRPHNEDCFGVQTRVNKLETPMGRSLEARGLYILCDGMGGHSGGEVASSMAVETLKQYFQENWHDDQLPSEETIRKAVHAANQAIYDVNQEKARSGSGRMGTTLVMMLVQNTNAAIAHVGDSRLYRLTRKRGLEQLTVDHEVGQREINRGVDPEIAYSRPDAHQLTQALGPRNEQFVNPDVQFFELNEDTLFVLCSDGLSDNELVEDHWQTHLAPLLSSRANLDQGILQLIDLANEHNGHDNITAILIRVKVRPNFEQQHWGLGMGH